MRRSEGHRLSGASAATLRLVPLGKGRTQPGGDVGQRALATGERAQVGLRSLEQAGARVERHQGAVGATLQVVAAEVDVDFPLGRGGSFTSPTKPTARIHDCRDHLDREEIGVFMPI